MPRGRVVGATLGIAMLSFAANPASKAQPGTIAPVTAAACASMRAHGVLAPGAPIDCPRLSLVTFSYVDFEGRSHDDGQIVVMDAVASHVLQIFAKLRELQFPIHKAVLMDHYEGSDDASMADNNTSAFNSRKITGGNSLSMHAYGLAIDINPVENPYAKRAGDKLVFSPPAGVRYANRFNDRPRKATVPGFAEDVIEVFANEGFLIWGGYWDDPIDYQHFQVSGRLAEQLARLPPPQAQQAFEQYVERYRDCRRSAPADSSPSKCIIAAEARLGG